MDTVQTRPEDAVRARVAKMRQWIQKYGQGCQNRQTHLEPGSVERVYWHYGYLSALQEVERLLSGQTDHLG